MPDLLEVLPSPVSKCPDVTRTTSPSSKELAAEARSQVDRLIDYAAGREGDDRTFMAFEKALVSKVFELARLLIALFLCQREERLRRDLPANVELEGKTFKRKPAQARNLNTRFGVIRYWRTYLLGPGVDGTRSGFHPLDAKLGLTSDRMSMGLLSLSTRLSTKLSFAQTHAVLGWFLLQPPSTEVIEQTVLGLGRRTGEWFKHAPPPPGDGEVLIIMIDSKASPTATDEELRRRRGKRRSKSRAKSPRHRGREKRGRYGSRRRRAKGDKSKNGRAATMVVMYTLKRSGRDLLGPINRRFYASFAPKRHAFEVARREADKRGFQVGSGKLVQLVTDGDDDLALYAKQYFPGATHTLDVMHALEYVWTAGECLHRKGGKELTAWMEEQREQVCNGNIGAVLVEFKRRLLLIPPTGPGNKGRRQRLTEAIQYLEKRTHMMNYGDLLHGDLEIGSGSVEGAIKNIIGARFDMGGMRWIRERAEALLQLRCIEMNGDWDRFIDRVHDDLLHVQQQGCRLRLQQATPAPLPTLAEAA